MTQKEKVLKHMLRVGSISAYEAIMDYGITQLGARIFELKEDGVKINTARKTNKGTGKHYVRYSVEELPEEALA